MSYDFTPHKKNNKKHVFNKQEKRSNKKLDIKQKKIDQKWMVSKQLEKESLSQSKKGNDISVTRDDIVLSPDLVFYEGYVAAKAWNRFSILSKSAETFLEAELSESIPLHLRSTFIVWDLVYYHSFDGVFLIEKRWVRKNYLSRTKSSTARFGSSQEQIIAANIDLAVIVTPIKQPAFDHKLLDRYLVLCQYYWVVPIVCLNKIDLSDKRDPVIKQYKASGISVLECSTITGVGVLELKKLLLGKVTILLGKSWVGKSSLVNALCFDKTILTQVVNNKSWEGKHTTTSSELYKREANSYIIDTPGVRALGLDQIAKADLQRYFPEFWVYTWQCKYAGCFHDIEPDCAVKNALSDGKINTWRYDSYIRILGDLI